jgi:hypothetical protein
MNLFNALKVPNEDIRGMGIVASNLVHDDSSAVELPEDKISYLFDAHRKRVPLAESNRPTTNPTGDKRCEHSSEVCPINDVVHEQSQCRIEDEGFVLPNLSQIHMSQVDELPSPMRRAIISQMDCIKKTASRLDAPQCYKQTNVPRLFKLAEVKARPGDVFLNQLGCLPLELQLQIANEDSMSVPGRTRNANHCRIDRSSLCEPLDVLLTVANQEESFDHEMSEPFDEFMDQHSAIDDDNVRNVIDFMCLCVSEGRVADVVKLLRQLRNRTDVWTCAFSHVYEAVDDQVERCMGNRLDRSWV